MLWRYLSLHNTVYEGMAGIIVGLIILNLPFLITTSSESKACS